jgi:hypothetical protein
MTEKPTFRAALVEAGVVVNTIIADEDFAIDGYLVVPSETAEIGDIYNGAGFTRPAPQPDPGE